MTGFLLVVLAGIFAGAVAYLLRPASVLEPSSLLWWLHYGPNPTRRTSLTYWQIDRSSGHVLPLPEWNARRWPTVSGYTIRNGVGRVLHTETGVWWEQDGERRHFELPLSLEKLDVAGMNIRTTLSNSSDPFAGEPKP